MGSSLSAPQAPDASAASKTNGASSPALPSDIVGGRGRSQRKGRGKSQRKGRGKSQRKGRGRGRGRSHRSH